jgi:ribosomal protein S27AE
MIETSFNNECPACRYGTLTLFGDGSAHCCNGVCDYTTAGQPEHDPEPSPEPEVAVERIGMGEYRISDFAAIDQRNLETCPQCGAGRGSMSTLSFGIDDSRVECGRCGFQAMGVDLMFPEPGPAPDKVAAIEKLSRELAACDELDRARPGLHVPRRSGRAAADAANAVRSAIASSPNDGKWVAAWTDEARPGHKPKCSGCGVDLWQMRGGFVECPNRNCALSGSAQYAAPWPGPSPVPNPEAEVTELERLRCLVKTLEGQLTDERSRSAAWQNETVKLRIQRRELEDRLKDEKSAHLSTRLKLVTALADLQSLRESYAECVEAEADESEQMQRSAADHYGGAKSRLGSVPERVFHRGPYVSYCEED